MQYLTPTALRSLAPATRHLPRRDRSLVDTADFLKHLGDNGGYRPVFAAQGTPHTDTDATYRGRHLVIAANDQRECIAILNSHTVYRKAWLAAGFWLGADQPLFLLGAAVPLRRWRGWREPLTELIGYQSTLKAAKTAMEAWKIDSSMSRWLAKRFASTAYLPDHKTASPKDLMLKTLGMISGWHMIAAMMKTALDGGLEPAQGTGIHGKLRKLKPIQGPDALMQAGNRAFRTGLEGQAKFEGVKYEFPHYQKT